MILANFITHYTGMGSAGFALMGSILAIVCSWERNRSILWAILAGVFSWVYVLYFALTRKPGEKK